MMQRIVAVIRPEKLEEVKIALEKQGYPGMMTMMIEGHGRQKGLSQQFRGREYMIEMIPKTKVEIIAKDEEVTGIVKTILKTAKTGDIGDGKIFVSPVTQVYRIRTEEEGNSAL